MKSFKGLAATVAASNKKAKGDDDGRSPSRSGAGVLGSTKIGALMNKLREQQDHGAASVAASLGGDRMKQKLVVWPEWSDADINAEKWDVAHKGKEKDKSKSPVVQHLFEDPDGRIELPPILRAAHWMRPQDYITEKTPTVVDTEALAANNGEFDLLTKNEQVHESEVMRWITSQICALWRLAGVKGAMLSAVDPGTPGAEDDDGKSWHPWEHIYAINKVSKGPNVPVYNPHGKYVVKLYWMGSWRKVVIDDTLPFDDNDCLLLPCTTLQHEIWPMLLAKALIKVASLDYAPASSSSEFTDFSVINCLTGWLPETIPLQYGHTSSIWNLLKTSLTEWKLPEIESPTSMEGEDGRKTMTSQEGRMTQQEQDRSKTATERPDPKSAKTKDKGKDDKKKDKSTPRNKSLKIIEPPPPVAEEKTLVADEGATSTGPEIVVFAAFNHPPKYPVRVSALAEMADASESLRQSGISHMYPHPVFITQTRSCPLEPPPPPEIIPAWKQIRPRKKKVTPSDEPVAEPEPEKPIQCVSLTSPFVHYKVSPVPIPRDTHRPASALERGSTRASTPCVPAIEETDENAPERDEVAERLEAEKQKQLLAQLEKQKAEELAKVEEALLLELPASAAPFMWNTEHSSSGSVPRKRRGSITDPTQEDRPRRRSSVLTPHDGQPLSHRASMFESPSRRGSVFNPEAALKRHSSIGHEGESRRSSTISVLSVTSDMSRRSSTVSTVSSTSTPPNSRPGSLTRRHSRVKASKKSKSKKSPKGEKADKKDTLAAGKDKVTRSRTGSHSSSNDKVSTKSTEAKSVADPSIVVTEAPNAGMHLDDPLDMTETAPSEMDQGNAAEDAPSKEIWMDFQQFCKCFKTLYIFHKPHTYTCNYKHNDLRIQSAGTGGAKEKKSAPSTAAGPPVEDRSPYYMFVDNLQPTEIVVSLSSLCRWNDPIPIKDESRVNMRSNRESRADNLTTDSSSVVEAMSEPRYHEPVTPGLLTAEPYSWKSLVVGQPILRLRTTATRSAVLNLAEGRHVLRFNITAPLGYHIHLASSTNFVFGDEEKVMAELTKESCRFVDTATRIMQSLGKAISNINNESFLEAYEELCDTHCPYRKNRHLSKVHHFQIFTQSMYNVLRQAFNDGALANADMTLAWRTFFFDCNTPNILGLPPSNRPATGAASERGSAKKGSKRTSAPVEPVGEPQDPKLEQWSKGIAEPEERIAAVKIQRTQRAHVVRKVANARKPGTQENTHVHEQLSKAWGVLEPKIEEYGLLLLREMFKADSSLMQHYMFHKDEWNRISYTDYPGTYVDQPPNQWFLVFRDIFHVQDDMLCVPKLYVPIATCMLRVINNDTNEEIPRVFQKVAPYVYKKNKRGYTFVAEARTIEYPVVANKCKMRLIASLPNMPAPVKNEVNCAFQPHEIKNYYIPNEKNIILRYLVRVQEDHLVSVQMNTSKADVYIKLAILDNEEEQISIVGKGHVVIPSYIFLKDQLNDEDNGSLKRSSSRSSRRSMRSQSGSRSTSRSSLRGKGSQSSVGKGKRGNSGDRRGSRGSGLQSVCGSETDDDTKPHKYLIQATVLRDSWPLSESNWTFVQGLREIEKNEMKLSFKERAPSPPRDKLPSAASHKGKDKEKGAKGKGGKDKDKLSSRPPSTQFEHGKAHWTLRVISDQATVEHIEIKKDTERADEIRAMKKAWEEAEPGRAAKAMQSRQAFIKSRLIQVTHTDDEEVKTEDVLEGVGSEQAPPTEPNASPTPASITLDVVDTETVLTLEPPPQPPPKEILEPFDTTPFLRRTTDVPRLRDEEEIQRQTEEKQRKIAEYKAHREQVEAMREQDRINRNQAKVRQIEQCEAMQAKLDKLREEINIPREAYRQKLIERERLRQEAIAEQEAALKAEQDRNAPSPKGGRKSAKGKKGSAGKKKK